MPKTTNNKKAIIVISTPKRYTHERKPMIMVVDITVVTRDVIDGKFKGDEPVILYTKELIEKVKASS